MADRPAQRGAWIALGDRAIRFARPAVPARALVRAIRAWPGVVDVVIARDSIAAYFEREPAVDAAQLGALAMLRDDEATTRDVELRAVYDGVDVDEVAAATGLSAADVVRMHRDALYVVDTIGFAPGFAYLTGLDARLQLPRRATPRPRVPSGALAIADAFTAVYPFASPGGWHLIGRVVDTPMFGEHGARLQLGDRVRFVS